MQTRGRRVDRRVVVTGIGVLSPIGSGRERFWQALCSGTSGARPIETFPTEGLPVRFAATVQDFSPLDYMDRKEARRNDRFTQFALAASIQAVQDAGLTLHDGLAERTGVLIGSGIGGLATLEAQHRILLERGADRVSPYLVPMMIPDMAAGQVSIALGAKGHNATTVTACASGTHSIGDAFRIIQRGDADVMLAGGSEAAVTPLAIAAFAAARALSLRNDAPERASRPFDACRDGFVMGEGAGVVVLEALEHARQRGARIYAELVGYGTSADAYHVTAPAPDGAGAIRAMQAALRDAGLEPAAVDYVNAHGTSTPANDAVETAAIRQVFGERAWKIPVSSTKSMIGHLLGAAGAVETVATVLALWHQVLPPTINYEVPDPACDLDYVPNRARPARVRVAMKNSFGFGGHNAVLIFRRYEEHEEANQENPG